MGLFGYEIRDIEFQVNKVSLLAVEFCDATLKVEAYNVLKNIGLKWETAGGMNQALLQRTQ